jgi:endoglucanase
VRLTPANLRRPLPAPRRGRPAAVALALVMTAAATGLAPTAGAVTNAPGGQTTTSGLLPASATSFPTAADGWTALTATVGWAGGVGHLAAGALSMRTATSDTGAISPSFPVTPGARYSATAWMLSGGVGGHAVGLGLRFYDAGGTLISKASQLSQPVTDATGSWRQTNPVVQLAPPNAVTAAVTAVSRDGAAARLDYVDDVTLTRTTGFAAPVVGPLTTSGPNVLDANGNRVVLHGIQLGGLAARGWSATMANTEEIDLIHSWGANFVRLPLVENPALPGDCLYNPSYLSVVDRVVHDVTSRGMVVLLDLHLLAVTPCGPYAKQKLPDGAAVRFWQILANRYKDNPLVAFDLFNEPHDVTDAVWRDGGAVISGGVRYVAVGMQRLYNAVRGTGATNLVFLSGNGWANTYPSDAPLTGATNVVWGVHAYTCPTKTPQQGGRCYPGPGGVEDPSGILGPWVTVGQSQPVMVTEFGFPDASDGYYIANTAAYTANHSWVGWNTFIIDGSSTSKFSLVRDTSPSWDPAASGMAVITGMLAD